MSCTALISHVVFLTLAVVQANVETQAFLALQKVSGQSIMKGIGNNPPSTKGRFFKDEKLIRSANQKNSKEHGNENLTLNVNAVDNAKLVRKFETSLVLKDPFTSKEHETSLLEKPETLHKELISGIHRGMKAMGIKVEAHSVKVTSLQLSRDLMQSQRPSLTLQYQVSDVDGCSFGDLIQNRDQRTKFEDAFMTRWAEQQAGADPFSVKFRVEPSLSVTSSTNCPGSFSQVVTDRSRSSSRAHGSSISRRAKQRSGGDNQVHGYNSPLMEPSLVTMMDIVGNMDRSDEGSVLHYDDSFQQALRASIAHGFWEVQNFENQNRAANEKKNYAPAAMSDVRLLKTRMRVYDKFNINGPNSKLPLLSVQYQLLHMDDPRALEIIRILEDDAPGGLKRMFQDKFGEKLSKEYADLRGVKNVPSLTVTQSKLALDPHLKAQEQVLDRNKQLFDIQSNPSLGFNHMTGSSQVSGSV